MVVVLYGLSLWPVREIIARGVLHAERTTLGLAMLLVTSLADLYGKLMAWLDRPIIISNCLPLSAWANVHIRVLLVLTSCYLLVVITESPRCKVTSPPQKVHIELGLLNLLVVPTLVRPGPMETYGLAVVLGVAKLVQVELLYRTGACEPL